MRPFMSWIEWGAEAQTSIFFSAAALESEILENQIDCRQPLNVGLALLGAPSFGASVPMLLQGGYGYGNILRLCASLSF